MSRWRRAAVGLLVVVALLSSCGGPDPRATAALPAVTLPAFDAGPPLKLGELRGPAILNLWSSTCGPCRREMPLYQQFSERYGARVPVIGIDFEDHQPGDAAQLVRRTGVTYDLYTDVRGDLAGRAGMPVPRALPTLVLVDASGDIAHLEYVEITSVDQLADLVSEHLGVTL